MNKQQFSITKVLSRNIYFIKKSRKFFATNVWSYTYICYMLSVILSSVLLQSPTIKSNVIAIVEQIYTYREAFIPVVAAFTYHSHVLCWLALFIENINCNVRVTIVTVYRFQYSQILSVYYISSCVTVSFKFELTFLMIKRKVLNYKFSANACDY